MKSNTTQSTDRHSSAAENPRDGIVWGTSLEKKLAKFALPALFHALHNALNASDDVFSLVPEMLAKVHRNSHQLVDISFPLDMTTIYEAFEQHYDHVMVETDGDPDYLPTLSGYIGALVLSKLWRLCDLRADCPKQSYDQKTVTEITTICLLAEHARRICNADQRAWATRKPLTSAIPDKKFTFKWYRRTARKFYAAAAQRFSEWSAENRALYSSLDDAVMAVSETEAFPYDYIECYQILRENDAALS